MQDAMWIHATSLVLQSRRLLENLDRRDFNRVLSGHGAFRLQRPRPPRKATLERQYEFRRTGSASKEPIDLVDRHGTIRQAGLCDLDGIDRAKKQSGLRRTLSVSSVITVRSRQRCVVDLEAAHRFQGSKSISKDGLGLMTENQRIPCWVSSSMAAAASRILNHSVPPCRGPILSILKTKGGLFQPVDHHKA